MRKEIVAKTIQKRIHGEYKKDVHFEIPLSKQLGCWVINEQIFINHANILSVNGSFDIQGWIGVNNNSDSKIIAMHQEFSIPMEDNTFDQGQMVVSFTTLPHMEKYCLTSTGIQYTICFTYAIEWICDTKLYIEVANEDYDNIIDASVNENYLELPEKR